MFDSYEEKLDQLVFYVVDYANFNHYFFDLVFLFVVPIEFEIAVYYESMVFFSDLPILFKYFRAKVVGTHKR